MSAVYEFDEKKESCGDWRTLTVNRSTHGGNALHPWRSRQTMV